MSSSGPTKIIGGESSSADHGRRQDPLSSTAPDRLQQLAAAFAAEARPTPVPPALEPRPAVARATEPINVSARRAALAAALQEWSGAASGTLRTTALAALAASRSAKVRQEATREPQGLVQETVFEAFFRGVEGRPESPAFTGIGAQQ